jgi:thioredoxin 1
MPVYNISNAQDLQKLCKDASTQLIVIDMYATWCGPCKMISPKIDSLADKYKNAIFIKVNVDEAEDISNHFNITSMPTIIYIKNYNEVDRVIGANIQKIEEVLKKHL